MTGAHGAGKSPLGGGRRTSASGNCSWARCRRLPVTAPVPVLALAATVVCWFLASHAIVGDAGDRSLKQLGSTCGLGDMHASLCMRGIAACRFMWGAGVAAALSMPTRCVPSTCFTNSEVVDSSPTGTSTVSVQPPYSVATADVVSSVASPAPSTRTTTPILLLSYANKRSPDSKFCR
jgi:hypothetical protein